MKIPLPLGGLHDGDPYAEQPAGTSADLLNMSPVDPVTGRDRLSQRAGHGKYCSAQIGSAKIADLNAVVSDNPRVTYASLGNSVVVDRSSANSAVADVLAVETDRVGNVYKLVSRLTVIKENSAGAVVWTLTLPSTDTAHVARALFVDVDYKVYVGVSAGGNQSTAQMWCYRPVTKEDGTEKPELVWDLDLAGYVEEIRVKNGKLYTVQNFPDRGRAEVVVYESYDVADPTETQRTRTVYPANGMDVNGTGEFGVCSEPTVNRGFNPKARDASETSEDWNPRMLDRAGERIWSWYAADSEDDFILTPVTGAPDNDRAAVDVWLDKSGYNRHLYGDGVIDATRTSPKLRLNGSGGGMSVQFNGTTSKLISATSGGIVDDGSQVGTLPGYTGAMFVLVMVVKVNDSTDRRWLFGQHTTAANENMFFLNRDASTTLAGTNTSGSACWYEVGVGATGNGVNTQPNQYTYSTLHPWQATAPSGSRHIRNGFMVVSLVFSNAQAGFNSVLRINGNPVDVWTSPAATWTDGFQIGEVTTLSTGTTQNPGANCQEFDGEVMELIVLRDYRTTNGVLSLITQPGAGGTQYPNSAFSGIPHTSNTELEKLEGYIAHKWGAAHCLPGGTAARLQFSGNAADNDTVTIGATTYRFKTVMAAINDVQLGASASLSALALIRAINLSGTAGTDYFAGTALNASMWAFPQRYNEDADTTPSIILRSLAQTSDEIVTTETGANLAFTAATSQTSITPTGAPDENDGFYPHPFARSRVLNFSAQVISTGGPPRAADADYTLPSKAGLLTLPYGILVKHASGGRPRWCAVSGYSLDAGGPVELGGIGYGVRVNSAGDWYSCGPRQAAIASSAGAGTADDVDVRKFIDLGDSFSITRGSTSTTAWEDNPGALTYQYPRMAVDAYDNLFVPITSAGTETVIGYAKLGSGSSSGDNADEILVVTSITDNPNAYAVAVDPVYPSPYTLTRPKNIYVGGPVTGSSNYSFYKLRLISETAASGSFRSFIYLAVCAGDIKTFTTGAVATPTGGSAALSSTAQYISSTVAYKEVVYVDGVSAKVYTASTGVVTALTATGSGEVPQRAKLVATWRGRLVMATQSQWFMSKVGDIRNWDYGPEVVTFTTAMSGTTALAGQVSDIINALVPIGDDLLLFGGDHSIRRLTGDPAIPTSKIDLITDTIGMSFGKSWTRDPQGNIYFFASRGGVYVMPPAGGQPQSLTQGRIQRRLESINLASYHMRLEWNDRDDTLHVYQCPFGAGGTVVAHYRWHRRTNSWWVDNIGRTGTTTVQPTTAFMSDGDAESDRIMLIGCEDGYVRKISETGKSDDGVSIAVRCLIGPIVGDAEEFEAKCVAMHALLAGNQDGCEYETYASDVADDKGEVVHRGTLEAGRNSVPARMAGAHIWILLLNRSVVTGTNPGTRFSFESMHLDLYRGARKAGV